MHGDNSVDLTISNHQGNWCSASNPGAPARGVTGNAINGIRGYKPGTYSVTAYSDSNCGTELDTTTFTIPSASLAATVNSDRSVDLTLTNGPSPWYFRISGGTCTTASGTTVSNIQGYKTGSYGVGAFSGSGCKNLIAHTDFTIPEPPPSNATLTTTVTPGPAANLTLSNGPNDWWFRINWWGQLHRGQRRRLPQHRRLPAGERTTSRPTRTAAASTRWHRRRSPYCRRRR